MAKKLYRNVDDKLIAGVCSGIGEYIEIDSTIIRVVFLASVIFGGISLWFYMLLWLY